MDQQKKWMDYFIRGARASGDLVAPPALPTQEREWIKTGLANGDRVSEFVGPVLPNVSDAERHNRKGSFDFALASIGLEGFKPGALDEELALKYITGRITLEDALKAVHESLKG